MGGNVGDQQFYYYQQNYKVFNEFGVYDMCGVIIELMFRGKVDQVFGVVYFFYYVVIGIYICIVVYIFILQIVVNIDVGWVYLYI